MYELDVIVEITGDCPIIDVSVVDSVVNEFIAHDFEYASNSNIRSYPDGMDVQVYKTETLANSSRLAITKLEREHVTLHIRKHPELYSILDIEAPENLRFPELGLTLDTQEDYDLLSNVIENLEPLNQYFGLEETLNYLKLNPQVISFNRNVIRKGDT
jgi:spore coat polysaccharide biosynthesis protein SpsF